jgi:superfamily II DNA or RNA helicase
MGERPITAGDGTFGGLLRSLDPRPEVRFREFERICRWLLQNAPEYRSRIRQVWLWSEWPEAWGRDAGIDLVAEERDGNLWAIQAKLYDRANAIKKSDVDSFLSESGRHDFTYRLLIATTDKLSDNAKKVLNSPRWSAGYLLLSDLELMPVVWPALPSDLRPRRSPPKTPLPHVRAAVDATVKGLSASEKGQLVMACGTGKTLAGLWIAERLPSTRTLVLVPSLSLVKQTLREWNANASGPFEHLAVCSDQTVVGEDELIQHTSELGLPVTTSPERIAAFLRPRGRRVVFATYQSSPQIAAAYRWRTPIFDLAIADEAHRCAGRVSSEFATILDPERIRARRRLFMTATPRFYTRRLRHEARQLDIEVASMDDRAVFGPVLHRLTFGEAIERELLSDYQVAVVGVDDETYRAWAERGELITRDGHAITDARTLAAQIALAKSMRMYDLHRVISFHGRVRAARAFSNEMPDVVNWIPEHARPSGELWSEHVSGAMTSGQRDRLLLRFRNLEEEERGLLSNARCLGEGVDVPAIDAIAFIDPRRSTIDILQAVGRAIRKAPDKKWGTIVLPVFLTDETPEQALNDSTFKNVWEVVKALRAHDEQLGEELDDLRRNLALRRSPPQRPGKIKLDLPASYVGASFADAFNTRLVERTTASWEFCFGLLIAYVSRTGTSRVPAHYIEPNGYKLGQWVASQRSSHNRGELSDARAKQLEDLPEWTWHTHRDAWEDGYERMRRFVAREGHADVPKGFVDQDESRLDLWALHQRADYKSGKLTTERARRLEELDGWKWEPDEAAFNHGLDRLGAYVERHSSASVPNEYVDEDGFKLGDWVQNRRKGYKQGHLAASHIAALEAMPGWSWSLRDDAWETGYKRLQHFALQHRHAQVPRDYQDQDGYLLGSWVHNQRHAHAIGRLAADRVARLEHVDGWTWGTSRRRRSTFDSGLAELVAYVDVHGDARVPAGAGFDLGAWCMRHRTLRKAARLSIERVEALDALGFVWDQLQHDFDRGASELTAYIAAHRDANVPQKHTTPTGFNLGTWCSECRKQRKAGRLSAERVAALDALGFVWDQKQQDFERGLGELAAHVAPTGDARVPSGYVTPTGFNLGGWCSERRKQRKAGRLSAERVAALDALGFVWDPLQEAFDRGIMELAAHVAANGDARVPSGYTTPSGFKLGTWCAGCREKHKVGQLPSQRVEALDALGFVWDPLQHDFERGLIELAAYVAANGDARVPTKHITSSGFKLGGWCSERRNQHKAGRLGAERVAALEAVPGWTWDARTSVRTDP